MRPVLRFHNFRKLDDFQGLDDVGELRPEPYVRSANRSRKRGGHLRPAERVSIGLGKISAIRLAGVDLHHYGIY